MNLLGLLLVGCAPTHVPPARTEPTPATRETPVSDTFEDGPTTTPADAALRWLEDAGRRRLRIPVVLDRSGLGITARLGVADDAPKLRLDSGALSLTLDEHVADVCGTREHCTVWLEGTWGALVPSPLDPPGHVFAVRKVVGQVEDPASASMKIQAR